MYEKTSRTISVEKTTNKSIEVIMELEEFTRYNWIRKTYKGAQETIEIKDGKRRTTRVEQGVGKWERLEKWQTERDRERKEKKEKKPIL